MSTQKLSSKNFVITTNIIKNIFVLSGKSKAVLLSILFHWLNVYKSVMCRWQHCSWGMQQGNQDKYIRIRNCSTDMAFDIFNFCDEIFLNICNEIFLSCCSKCSVTQPSYNQGIRKVDTAVKIELATLSAYLNPLEIEPDTFQIKYSAVFLTAKKRFCFQPSGDFQHIFSQSQRRTSIVSKTTESGS